MIASDSIAIDGGDDGLRGPDALLDAAATDGHPGGGGEGLQRADARVRARSQGHGEHPHGREGAPLGEAAVDMPGVNPSDVKVQVEEGNVLVISGERRREKEEKGAAEGEEKEKDKEKEGGKYLRMERRMGKFMRKFPLPQNANLDSISASYKDGVLTVTVERMPPPEPKKPKSIEVKVN
uniref:SHSP domain-containing protein n=1 Tax=Ananas comosus var. bracteatus TaxID=296719 RepID=A0A6V7QQA7_ANACO